MLCWQVPVLAEPCHVPAEPLSSTQTVHATYVAHWLCFGSNPQSFGSSYCECHYKLESATSWRVQLHGGMDIQDPAASCLSAEKVQPVIDQFLFSFMQWHRHPSQPGNLVYLPQFTLPGWATTPATGRPSLLLCQLIRGQAERLSV